MRALFIGGHSDEELCFAGAMQHYNSPHYLIFNYGTAEYSEFSTSCYILDCSYENSHAKDPQGVADLLYSIRDKYDIVFTHSITDRHPLHRMVAEESLRVFNQSLLTYIGPWNGNEDPNHFIELTEEQLEKKITAMSCYKSQSHRKYMDPDFIRSWARYNGIKCGKLYAEGFKVVRLVQVL